MAATVRLLIDLGTPIHGIWCNRCMTSAGFAVPLNRLSEFGVSTLTVAYGCSTCRITGPGALDL